MSFADLLTGKSILVTGVEDDPDEPGMTRVYVGPRYRGQYVLATEEDAKEVRRAWADPAAHVFINRPEKVYLEKDGTTSTHPPLGKRE